MSKKMYLNALGITGLLGLRTEEVPVPGQDNVFVVVHELSAQDFAEIGVRFMNEGTKEVAASEMVKMYPAIVARAVKTDGGDPVFTEGQAARIRFEHLDWLLSLAKTALELGGTIVSDDIEEQPEKNE